MTEMPHRIKAWCWNHKDYAGQWHVNGQGDTRDYILATPEALAASPEVAKLIADAEARIIHIAAGIFPGGFDNNVAAIRRAAEEAGT